MGISRYGLTVIASTCMALEVTSKALIGWPSGVAGHVLRLSLAAIAVPAYFRLFYLSLRETRRRRAEKTRA